MSSNYEYKDKPFSSSVVEYHFDLQYGRKLDVNTAGRTVLKYHLEYGGLPPKENKKLDEEESLNLSIKNAMKRLRRKGRAYQISEHPNRWYIPEKHTQIYGRGRECVYCFYDPRDRTDAESKNKKQWGCNIGKTKRNFKIRVSEQTREWTQDPEIGLVLHTSDSQKLEWKIRTLLKTLDRHLPCFRAKGNDWYATSPDEVFFLYRVINNFKSGRTSNMFFLDFQ